MIWSPSFGVSSTRPNRDWPPSDVGARRSPTCSSWTPARCVASRRTSCRTSFAEVVTLIIGGAPFHLNKKQKSQTPDVVRSRFTARSAGAEALNWCAPHDRPTGHLGHVHYLFQRSALWRECQTGNLICICSELR